MLSPAYARRTSGSQLLGRVECKSLVTRFSEVSPSEIASKRDRRGLEAKPPCRNGKLWLPERQRLASEVGLQRSESKKWLPLLEWG